jgi:hypothetical protein
MFVDHGADDRTCHNRPGFPYTAVSLAIIAQGLYPRAQCFPLVAGATITKGSVGKCNKCLFPPEMSVELVNGFPVPYKLTVALSNGHYSPVSFRLQIVRRIVI